MDDIKNKKFVYFTLNPFFVKKLLHRGGVNELDRIMDYKFGEG